MRDVAIVSFAQLPNLRRDWERDEIEMLLPVVTEAIERSGIPRREIGFTVSGSSDFLTGRPFSHIFQICAVNCWLASISPDSSLRSPSLLLLKIGWFITFTGVSPKTARKVRMKCASEMWATEATARTSSGSA